MPDKIFDNPRLASVYDAFDGQRTDLACYLAIVKEFGAKSVLDIGCGTGCFAHLLNESSLDVTGLDPAQASLEVAQSKPNASQVRWILGVATDLPPMAVDLAVMTGNVAQVFLTDESWEETLLAARQALNSDGHLVFEVRNPAQEAWLEWTRESTYKRMEVPNEGFVESWCEVTEVTKQLVSFSWTYKFESDGKALTSDSTIRFRDKDSIQSSLKRSGFLVKEIRDAPDRPGKEFLFIAALS